MQTPKIASEKLWSKDPKAAMIIFLASVNFGLMCLLFSGESKTTSVYKTQADFYYQQYRQEQHKNDSLFTVISDLTYTINKLPYSFDSTLKSKTQTPLRKIFKNKK